MVPEKVRLLCNYPALKTEPVLVETVFELAAGVSSPHEEKDATIIAWVLLGCKRDKIEACSERARR